MKKHIFTLIVGIAGIINIDAQITETKNALSHVGNHFFIENKGQWPDEILYLTSISGLDAWITKNGILYDFNKLEEIQNEAKTDNALPGKFKEKNYTRTGHKVWYKLQGNNITINTEGKGKQTGYYNYLLGNDPGKHATNVGLYKEAVLKNVYNGIDIHYYFDKGNIRYDYVVHPGADPSQISFVLEGADKIYLNLKGDLVFNTRFGEVALAELYTYQETKANKVSSSFVKTQKGWGIAIGDYNREQTIIIDPLIYSTYLGGNGNDGAYSIAIDASGNAYVTGTAKSTNYDTTLGAYQTSNAGNVDVFVTKLNATGTALVYSTYLGGSGEDDAYSIAIDTSGNGYVTGYTLSTNFDITSGAYQTSNAGNGDIFVTKLNATGTALIYSTYLGGSGDDGASSIAIDTKGNAYIAGGTKSTDYDTTSGAYQTINGGGVYEIFVTKLNSKGTALVYSTYLGGSGDDGASFIAIDTSGNAYVTGNTKSTNYDITSGAYQTSNTGGSYDAFVTKLNAKGTALVYSTYLGGSDEDIGRSITIDASGNAYVTGYTLSTNFDITSGAYQTSLAGFTYDVFVTKLNTTGTALVYSTYLGGTGLEYGFSIAINASGNAYVTGWTLSTDFDTTSGAYQTSRTGSGAEAFVTKLNTTGTALVYSTYLGGSNGEVANSIVIDAVGNPYVTGETYSTDYDTTSGAYKTSYAGGYRDGFVTKICLFKDSTTISLSSSAGTDAQNACINNAITPIKYATTDATDANFTGLPAGVTGSFAANRVTISGTPTASGKFYYTILLNGGCGTTNAKGTITVNPDNTIQRSSASGTDSQTVCINKVITSIRYTTKYATGASLTGLPAGVTGSFTANLVNIKGTPTTSGIFPYTITLTGGCGTVTAKGSITVNPDNTISLSSALSTDSQSLCTNNAITDITYATTSATGATVTGLPAGVTGSFASNAVAISGTPTASGTFPYTITLTGGCGTVTAKGSIIVKPDNTIGLSSALGTDSQSLCINNAITDITYATTGASGASVTGLPAGVTGSFAVNTFTINGTPTASGVFPYVITLTGGCGTFAAKGSITVKPDNTIGLSSASGTDSQSLCINTAITGITYATTSATSATVTGLPAGVTSSFAANAVTISGTPSVKGTFPFTTTPTGGCGTITSKGRIIVNPNNTIILSSSSGTDSQSVKVSTPITSITYATTGAIGANFNGLPAGVTGSFTANVVTINGTPTVSGTFPYTITLTGGCGTETAKGSIIVGGLGIVRQANVQALQLYPNPATTEISIKGVFNVPVLLEIIDVSGRTSQALYSLDSNIIKLQVSTLANGIYSIRIIDAVQVFHCRMIVQH